MSGSTKGSQYSGGDIEKSQHGGGIGITKEGDLHHTTIQELEARDDGVPRNKGIFAALWKLARRFDSYGAETRGIERVLPEERAVVRRSSLLFIFSDFFFYATFRVSFLTDMNTSFHPAYSISMCK